MGMIEGERAVQHLIEHAEFEERMGTPRHLASAGIRERFEELAEREETVADRIETAKDGIQGAVESLESLESVIETAGEDLGSYTDNVNDLFEDLVAELGEQPEANRLAIDRARERVLKHAERQDKEVREALAKFETKRAEIAQELKDLDDKLEVPA